MLSLIAFCVFAIVLLGCVDLVWGRPGEGIGLPIVAILSFVYLYLEQPLELVWNHSINSLLNDKQIAEIVLMAAVMLGCFLWGWRRATNRSRPVEAVAWDPAQVWNFGFVGASVGLALLIRLIISSGGFEQSFSKPHGAGVDLEGVTAYIHLSPFWMLSGESMMLLAFFRLPPRRWRQFVIASFAVILYGYSTLISGRGYMFGTTAVLLVSYAIGKRSRPTIAQTAPFWCAAGVLVLLVVGYRAVLHFGEDRPEAPGLMQALTANARIDDNNPSITGNEFVYAAAVLDTVDTKRQYDLGLQWIYTYTLHPIPRIWWPDKPYSFESPGITWDDIDEVTGIRIADGSAPSIVAEIYQNFGLFSILFFFLFGSITGTLYCRAQFPGNPLAAVGYVMLCALSLNVFAQGFETILVFWPYAMIPVFVYSFHSRFSTRRARTTHSPRTALMRGPDAVATNRY